jgi:hypothetical protein
LIRAAWTYVHTFAPDILRAQQRYQELADHATTITGGHDARLDRYLADPANPIPVHTGAGHDHDEVHWSLLALMLGYDDSSRSSVFPRSCAAGRRRITRVEDAVTTGHPTTTGVIDVLSAANTGTARARPGIRGSPPALSDCNAACFKMPATYWSWAYQ